MWGNLFSGVFGSLQDLFTAEIIELITGLFTSLIGGVLGGVA
jgi:hypothetical protein